MKNEDNQSFIALVKRMESYFEPKGVVEEGMIQEMAAYYWRTRRLWAIETSLLNKHLPPPDADVIPGEEFEHEMDRIAGSWTELSGRCEFTLLNRYEGAFQRLFHRDLARMLQRKQSKLVR